MGQVYPIFTDGEKFYHGESPNLPKARFAYFSKLKLKEWEKEEKPTLDKKKAKQVFESWNKKDAKGQLNATESK